MASRYQIPGVNNIVIREFSNSDLGRSHRAIVMEFSAFCIGELGIKRLKALVLYQRNQTLIVYGQRVEPAAR